MRFNKLAIACLLCTAPATMVHADWWEDAKERYTPPHSSVTDLSTSNQDWGVHVDGGVWRQAVPNVNYSPLQMNWEPPNVQAGCGGINLNLGSFDILASTDVSAFIEAVPQQALYYAIGLAMDALSPPAKNMMDYLQDKINTLNMDALNSCKVAQNLVDPVANSMREAGSQMLAEQRGDASHSDNRDLSPEIIESLRADNGGNWTFRILDNTYTTESVSNVEFEELLRLSFAIIGTTIVELVEDTSGTDEGDFEYVQRPIGHAHVSLRDFIYGFEGREVYYCESNPVRRGSGEGNRAQSSEQCLTMTKETMNWKSLSDDIMEAYTTGPNSLIRVMRRADQDTYTPSATQQRVLGLMNPQIRSQIEDLIVGVGRNEIRVVEEFILKAADAIALETGYVMYRNILTTMDLAIDATLSSKAERPEDRSHSGEGQIAKKVNNDALEAIRVSVQNRLTALEADYRALAEEHNLLSLMGEQREILARAQRQRQFVVQNANRTQ